jgi:alkanesulfonate monooxygenase SsuD/methylene tetrahydromethanopterin reductase-like flavin-dependent oxidoreductase (luciferase family)
MLPHYSAFKVVEQSGVEAIAPGRHDLGVGRTDRSADYDG